MHFFNQILEACITNPVCDEMRIHFLQAILSDLSPEIIPHHQAILNKDFKLLLKFKIRKKGEGLKGLELLFSINGIKLSAMSFLTKYKIHADHLRLLFELCSSRPCVSQIRSAADSVLNDINIAMLNQFLIPEFLKTINKKPTINAAFASRVTKIKLGVPQKGKKQAKRRK